MNTQSNDTLRWQAWPLSFVVPMQRLGLFMLLMCLFPLTSSAQEKTLDAPVDHPKLPSKPPINTQDYPQLEVETDVPKNKDAVTELLKPKLTVDTQYLGHANLAGHAGGYDMRTTNIEVSNLLFSFKYEHYRFHWHDVDHLPFGDGVHAPFTEIQNITLYGRIPYRLGANQLIYSGIGVSSGFEKTPSNTVTYEAFSFYSHDFSEKDSWQIGGYFKYHPVETMVLPIIEYTYNKKRETRTGMYGHLGFPISQIGYYISSKWRTDFGAVYRNSVAKLAEDSPIANNGFSYYSSWRGEWAWYYLPVKQFEIKAALEYTLYRNLINYDKNYREIGEYRVNNSIGAGVGIIYNF